VDVYGFTHLLEENYLAYEMYNKLCSRIVQESNLQRIIWNSYSEEIELEGFDEVFRKLEIIYDTVDSHQKGIQESEERMSQKRALSQPTKSDTDN